MAKHGQQQVEEHTIEYVLDSNDLSSAEVGESGLTEADEQAINEDLEAMVEARKVDELSKSTLGSYVKKASQDAADKAADFGRKDADQKSVQRSLNRHGMSSADHDAVHKAYKTTDSDVRKPEKKAAKRLKGINTAVKKLTKEEESIEEVDKGFGSRMKAADAAANIYSKEKRKPENDTIRAIRKKYADKKKEEQVDEKTLTPAEKKKREEIAQAISRDDPKMPMDKKMAIATAQAKKVAESVSDRTKELIERAINRKT